MRRVTQERGAGGAKKRNLRITHERLLPKVLYATSRAQRLSQLTPTGLYRWLKSQRFSRLRASRGRGLYLYRLTVACQVLRALRVAHSRDSLDVHGKKVIIHSASSFGPLLCFAVCLFIFYLAMRGEKDIIYENHSAVPESLSHPRSKGSAFKKTALGGSLYGLHA